ncbi:carbohydrate ABC transporter permease [Paenibacillus radicis (ex Xue et al. 2023)]|uniref:Carbohydrate ABC transporter permease n=1 Tax=Paenibacillus radicis (ex Xue et al. 2023) TaxID=2972489 RepID=A0ABT1YLZ0_9BACL|nr:carbohydrate ABC transporter permease [Paenibacillus radicis (ex Xue et al. 2023)]MCR8633283.1 carbohydrate ABC transporter permease [Paenibacillus radicis (ex Xue et al. 2023)]
MVEDRSWGSRLFDAFNYVFLSLFALATILPFIYVLAGSLTAPEEMIMKKFVLFPTQFSLEGYRYIFSSNVILKSLCVTVFITIAGTLINLLFTCLMAYPLSRKDLDGRKPLMLMVIFSMLFSGGMIPTFLVVKTLGLLDSYWALLLPGAISAFNLIVLKNFFQQMPEGMEEAAKIDGCNDLRILWQIVIPLSLPAIATFSLFYAVGHWNSFFSAVLYINDNGMWPVQVWLRQIVILAQGGIGDSTAFDQNYIVPPAQIIKMAVIVISTLPILCVYPFLQKHFAKGAMIGSVKG